MLRTIVRIALLTAAFFCMVNSSCFHQKGWTYFELSNKGRDPVHVSGTRIAVGQSTEIGSCPNEGNEERSYSMSRNDINLGTIKVKSTHTDETAIYEATITMTEEPHYFDFQFSSDDPEVSVTYVRP